MAKQQKPIGPAMRAALDFATKYRGCWQGFHRSADGPIKRLAARGLVEISELSRAFRVA